MSFDFNPDMCLILGCCDIYIVIENLICLMLIPFYIPSQKLENVISFDPDRLTCDKAPRNQ